VEVEIADLRGQFNSFDLIGPKSSQVIRGALSITKGDNSAVKKQVRSITEILEDTLTSLVLELYSTFANAWLLSP